MSAVSRRAFLASAGAAAVVVGLPAGAGVPVAPSLTTPRPLPTLADLKEWSERALAVLQRHWPDSILGEVFYADPDEGYGYHGLRIRCDCPDASEKWGCISCSVAMPGTPMIGGMTGYYEPEWSETTAYGLLSDVLWWSDRPDGMTDAEWAEALAIVDMTPASHAQRMANLDREMNELAAEQDCLAAD